MNNLTEKQPFLTMVSFLKQYYQQTQSDDLGALLGRLQLCNNSITSEYNFFI